MARKSRSELDSNAPTADLATVHRKVCNDLDGRTTLIGGSPLLRRLEKVTLDKVGLLVSVRNATEARLAVASRVDVIDVKEPNQGPLGASDSATIDHVLKTIHGLPVTAALGELADISPDLRSCPYGPCALKAGLAYCSNLNWQQMLADLSESLCHHQELVAVAYADWREARAPHPEAILDAAISQGIRWLLIDTWGKQGKCVLDTAPHGWLGNFLQKCRSHQLCTALAGEIPLQRIEEAAKQRPNLVAVRGAVCLAGREGSLSGELVAEAKRRVELATNDSMRHDRGAQEPSFLTPS